MTKDKITDEYIKAVQKQFKHYHAADTRFISEFEKRCHFLCSATGFSRL